MNLKNLVPEERLVVLLQITTNIGLIILLILNVVWIGKLSNLKTSLVSEMENRYKVIVEGETLILQSVKNHHDQTIQILTGGQPSASQP